MTPLKILHICGDYPNQILYNKLFNENKLSGFGQLCYVPIKNAESVGKFLIDEIPFFYSFILRKYHRFLYFTKIRQLKNHLLCNINHKEIKITHAHTLFSDGGIAYELYRKYEIPYVVAVRNVDINYYFKYALHTRWYGFKILENAKSIIFINSTYKKRLIEIVPEYLKQIVNNKAVVIPNGIDNFWHDNRLEGAKKRGNNGFNLIYVGDFTKNKNVISTINVVNKINSKNTDTCFLTIVGGGGENEKEIKNIILKTSNISYLGRITNLDELKRAFRTCDLFVMPSFHETFGLVYIEALSQGLPIIYSKNEGVDGFFEDGYIGRAIYPTNIDSIQSGIEWAYENYSFISENVFLTDLEQFDWAFIGKRYSHIYDSNN